MTTTLLSKLMVRYHYCLSSSRLTSQLKSSIRSISAVEYNSNDQEQNKESSYNDDQNVDQENRKRRFRKEVKSPLNSRLLRVAIIGIPNAGKSTLINQLLSYEVCPVSKRVHTTRSNQNAIYMEDETQIVFVDTPGLVNKKEIKKFSFNNEFALEPAHSLKSVDLVAVLHDLSNAVMRNKLDPRILDLLSKFPEKNSVLVINKVDLLTTKRKLLDVVRYLSCGIVGGKPIEVQSPKQKKKKQSHKPMFNKEELFDRTKKQLEDSDYNLKNVKIQQSLKPEPIMFTPQEVDIGLDKVGWPHFEDVFMISALNGNGVDLLKNYLVANARPSPWVFNEEIITDVPPAKLAVQIVQSKFLEYLPNEMPYKLSPYMEYWEKEASGELRIVIGVKSPNPRVTRRIIGHNGVTVLKITDETEKILMNLLHTPLNIHINVVTETAEKVNEE